MFLRQNERRVVCARLTWLWENAELANHVRVLSLNINLSMKNLHSATRVTDNYVTVLLDRVRKTVILRT